MPEEYAPVKASESAVSDEMANGGPAFGSFVSKVGSAIAEAQKSLDETLVSTAVALADKDIEVVAIWEQKINDDGEMEEGKPIKEKLPLVTYIMPTAYQWKQVILRADMYVAKFNVANGFNIKGSYKTETEGGMGGELAELLGTRASTSSSGETSFEQTASLSANAAAGWLHMEATLEPRPDIKPPQPFVVQKGPRMKVTAGPRENIKGEEQDSETIGRKVTLTVELRNVVNDPLKGKHISVQISEPLINYTFLNSDDTENKNGNTGDDGILKIELRREGSAYDKDKPPEPITVKTWLGLITQQVLVSI